MRCFQVVDELCPMNIGNIFNRFQFDNHTTEADKIRVILGFNDFPL